jgi:histone arginine demethylase JMJD6
MKAHHPTTTPSASRVPAAASATIDRRSRLSYAEFEREYLRPERPVIITDGLQAWPALTKWTPEFFRDVHGDKVVRVSGKDMRLGDFMDAVLASSDEHPSPYLNNLLVRQQFPEIAADILPEFVYALPDRLRSPLLKGAVASAGTRDGIPELLIAGRGARFNLHYDAAFLLGFVTQIHGDKEFLVFSPEDGRYLYQRPDDPRYSQIPNIFDVDLDRFPLFAKATPMRFVLGPGESIFNPAGWWHATRILSPSIAMVISTANASNWRAFRRDRSTPRPGVSAAKAWAVGVYLDAVGAWLDVKERLAGQPR